MRTYPWISLALVLGCSYLAGVAVANAILDLAHGTEARNWGWSYLLGLPLGAGVAAAWLTLRNRR